MPTGERLAASLRQAWNGDPWHGPSAQAVLTRLSATAAAHRRVRGSHTAWELVLHLITWCEVPLRRFDDPASEADDASNFPSPSDVSESQWQADLARLGDAVEALAARVAASDDAALLQPVGARAYTYATMIDGVAQHLAYHAGQAALIARPKEEVANLLAPAPVFPISALLLAELVDRFVYDAHFAPPRVVGWALLAVGGALAFWANQHFVARRTPAVPWRAPRRIVHGGPYRFTRNPMYLGFLLILAGIGCLRENPLYLWLLVPTWAFLHWGVVLREEPFLLRKFGASYQALLDSTRRWV